MTPPSAGPGWYPTPDGHRWWDGSAWTDQHRPASLPDRIARAATPDQWSRRMGWIAGGIAVIVVIVYMFH